MHLKVSKKQINLSKFLRHLPYPTFDTKNRYIDISARLSCSKLEFSTSFNPQNSNSAKLELEKTWKNHIIRAKSQNTRAKLKLDTCSNWTVWNLMKLKHDKNWAWSWHYWIHLLFKVGNTAYGLTSKVRSHRKLL